MAWSGNQSKCIYIVSRVANGSVTRNVISPVCVTATILRCCQLCWPSPARFPLATFKIKQFVC